MIATSGRIAAHKRRRAVAGEWMELKGVTNYSGPRIAVAPGSKWDSKIWDEGRYANVVETSDRFS